MSRRGNGERGGNRLDLRYEKLKILHEPADASRPGESAILDSVAKDISR